ncbi:hypothetical protein N7488_008256 [Penicillium malachiteum]|nr:hypothetical protein N7488_008256 [Penicillium malachiteum]
MAASKRRLAAESEVIVGWPGHHTRASKVPSKLRYPPNNRNYRPLWGYEIKRMMPRLQWIKLGLDPTGNRQLLHGLALKPRDPRRMDFPPGVTAEQATTDYSRALKEHVFRFFRVEFGTRGFDEITFQFVVTVPGIWSADANRVTIECAKRAGLAAHLPIKLVSEPEAAAIHTIVCCPTNLRVGERFVLCDAGGVTVDLVAMDILEISPKTRLRQVLRNDGGLCGSTFLNRRFEALLRKKFENSVWDPISMSHAFAEFEEFKRHFTGETPMDHLFPVLGLPNNRRLKINKELLRVSTAEILTVFGPVCREVIALIQAQIRRCRGDVDAVVLVGGFGDSPYIRQQVRMALRQTNIRLITPGNGWTAVSTGTLRKVAFGNRICVDQMACHNYGVINTVP